MASAAENKSAKRLKILDAGNRLFLARSVSETAIDDVVKLAGVAKGTFYLYFRDKTDLLDQIVMRHTAEIFMRACRTLRQQAQPMSVAAQLQFLTDEIVSYLRQNREVTALIDKRFTTLFAGSPYREIPEFRDDIEYLTALFTAQGMATECAQKRLYVLTQMIGSVCCDAILGAHPYTIDEILPAVHDAVRRMAQGGDCA